MEPSLPAPSSVSSSAAEEENEPQVEDEENAEEEEEEEEEESEPQVDDAEDEEEQVPESVVKQRAAYAKAKAKYAAMGIRINADIELDESDVVPTKTFEPTSCRGKK